MPHCSKNSVNLCTTSAPKPIATKYAHAKSTSRSSIHNLSRFFFNWLVPGSSWLSRGQIYNIGRCARNPDSLHRHSSWNDALRHHRVTPSGSINDGISQP